MHLPGGGASCPCYTAQCGPGTVRSLCGRWDRNPARTHSLLISPSTHRLWAFTNIVIFNDGASLGSICNTKWQSTGRKGGFDFKCLAPSSDINAYSANRDEGFIVAGLNQIRTKLVSSKFMRSSLRPQHQAENILYLH
ncbi:unnamed protein product [Calypogeia fissa]